MNLRTILNKASKKLKKNNIKTFQIDSEILLANTINKDRKYIILNLNDEIKKFYLKKFNDLIDRRSKGEPVAYLIKKKEFWNETFYINEKVLIPRPDTEIIVESVLGMFPKNLVQQ